MINRILILMFTASTIQLSASEQELITFELQDQFKNDHFSEDVLGSVVVVLCSDKNGSQYNDVWGRSISDSIKQEAGFPNVKFLPVADLRGVPFFLKGFVRGKFPEDSTRWVLMDWKGLFPKAYDLLAEACNIVIFNQSGQFIHKDAVYEMDEAILNRVLAIIRKTLRTDGDN